MSTSTSLVVLEGDQKSLSELLQKICSHLKKKFFDSLAVNLLGLYVNSVGHLVAYS
jgi:hypothetical protein